MKATKRFFGMTFASIVIWIGGSAINPNPLYAESLVGVATYYNPDFGPNGGAVVYALTDDGYLYKYDTVDGWDDTVGNFGALGSMVGASTLYYTTDLVTTGVVYALRVEGYLYRYETDFGFEYLGTWFAPDHIAQRPSQETASIQLHSCYPNPFNPVSTIPFTVRRSTKVRLSVFNLLGEQVAVLKDEVYQPGSYRVEFDGSDLAGGVYLYTLASGESVLTGKLTLLK